MKGAFPEKVKSLLDLVEGENYKVKSSTNFHYCRFLEAAMFGIVGARAENILMKAVFYQIFSVEGFSWI